jgi:hypothetical protein
MMSMAASYRAEHQISLLFAAAAMCSAARNANAMMVIVGWPRPDVTMLEPSQMNRFDTSWLR